MSNFMVANLTISEWTARKFDKEISRSTNKTYNAERGTSRVSKSLEQSGGSLDNIKGLGRTARNYFRKQTVQYDESNRRAIPGALLQETIETLSKMERVWSSAVTKYCNAQYKTAMVQGMKRQGRMYKPEDYPSERAIWDKFDWNLIIEPKAASLDSDSEDNSAFAALNSQVKNELRTLLKAENDLRMERVKTDLRERCKEMCGRFIEVLESPKVRIFDVLLSDATELSRNIPMLNVAEDVQLDAIAKMIGTLAEHPKEALKTSETARQATIDKAKKLLKIL